MALAAGLARLVPGQEGATLEGVESRGEDTGRSEVTPEKGSEA